MIVFVVFLLVSCCALAAAVAMRFGKPFKRTAAKPAYPADDPESARESWSREFDYGDDAGGAGPGPETPESPVAGSGTRAGSSLSHVY